MSRALAVVLCLLGVLAFLPPLRSESALELAWKSDRTVDARLEGAPLSQVLSRISGLTGWKVFVDPNLNASVSTTFKNVSQGEALKMLLQGFNYALVPGGREKSRLYVFETTIGDATRLVTAESAGKPKNWLANEIVLAVDPEARLDVEKLAEELGGKVIAKSEELSAYRLQFESAEAAEEARKKLATREDVDAQDNYAYQRPELQTSGSSSPASLFPIDPSPVTPGEQITIALIDTPIQQLDGKMRDFIMAPVNIGAEPTSLPPDPTHATSMAQTILNSLAFGAKDQSQAGKVRIQPYNIYGDSPTTTTFEVAQGLHKAIQANPHVINLSLGGTGQNPIVEYLLESAHQKQIMVFASAGNSPTTELTWPAASPYAIGVTAALPNGEIAPYANRGSFVDVKAPGTSRVHYRGQPYVSTGTSTATAFVSGQAAAALAGGQSAPQTVNRILQTYGMNAPTPPRR